MTPTRPRVSIFMGRSLDNFIAKPDGDIRWLDEGEPPPEGEDFGYSAFIATVDRLVMGRNTFEKVLEFDEWPYEVPVIVLSRRLKEVPEHLHGRVTIDDAAPEALLERLVGEGVEHLYVDGGQVIQSFLRAGLVDTMTLTTLPIVIGAGRPLFGELGVELRLRHTATRSWENGLVQSTYEVVHD